MCLTIYYETATVCQEAQPLINPRKRKVYKILSKLTKNKYKSPYCKFIYDRGFEYYEEDNQLGINKDIDEGTLEVEEGLHAYTTKSMAAENCSSYEDIIEMYIPKGALYLEDEEEQEIVSTRLIFPHLQKKVKRCV